MCHFAQLVTAITHPCPSVCMLPPSSTMGDSNLGSPCIFSSRWASRASCSSSA